MGSKHYITEFKSIKPQSNFLQNLSSPNLTPVSPEIQSIKTKAFIFMAMYVVSACSNGFAKVLLNDWRGESVGLFLAFIGICVIVVAYNVLYSAMESMWKMAKSAILEQNLFIYFKAVIVMNVALFISRAMANGVADDAVVRGLFSLVAIVAICCLIYSFILRYDIYKEVAYITNQPLFMWAFWLIVTIILSPIGILLYIIAWIKVREIRESMSAEGYDKLGQTSKNTTNNLKSFQITETQQAQIKTLDFSKSNDMDTIQSIESNTKSENCVYSEKPKKASVWLFVIIVLLIFIVIIIAAVATPRLTATRTDAQIATARSDIASAQKAIVAKVFADNINVKKPKAPNPNKSSRYQTNADYIEWGKWIIEIAGLDKNRWKSFGTNGVYPIDIKANRACYDESELPLLWINPRDGTMNFNPSRLSDNYDKKNGFCENLRDSYVSENGNGNRVIPVNSEF